VNPKLGRRAAAACTIATRNYLSYARVVAESYLRHHPGSGFYTLVVDGLPAGTEAGSGIEVVQPAELGLPYFRELTFKYDATELSTAVKPTFLSHLLEREQAIVYLDPDILVMRAFCELWELLRTREIVLTPHSLSPLPRDGLRPSEEGMLVTGAFNLGFLALRRSADTANLLDWWESRLRDACRADLPSGLFVDQKWADLIPGYFGSAAILRDPTYNVAYWNLHERTLERRGSTFLVGGRPVAFYHFSGYDPLQPARLTKRIPKQELARTRVSEGTPLSELLNLYSELHMRHGLPTCSRWPYGFSQFDNGIKIDKLLRRLYSGVDDKARASFGNPFEASGPESFLHWATRSGPDGLSPFAQALYRDHADLAAAFPNVPGSDVDAFLEWARRTGSAEMGYDAELVRARATEAV
jgi:hypothetical protein